MIKFMQRLIDAGHAYASEGDVYFDVASFPSYGSLSRQRVSEMQPAADSDSSRKRDARDFALWKSAKPGEPSWDTPWGAGRPGWHLECSAMAEKYCGPAFDIHGGGLDLIFPHHENEIAQSRSVGDDFASFWLHNAWVTTAGEKMSKSLGNSLLVSEVVRRVRPVELRYYLASAHYRSLIEYSESALEDAGTAYRRVESFVQRATRRLGSRPAPTAWPAEFAAAMDDDLGVPQALAVIHDTVRLGNAALTSGDDALVARTLGLVLAMLDVLGLDPANWAQSEGDEVRLRAVVGALVAAAIDERAQARADKDYAAADVVRDRLCGAGIVIEDTPDGAQWSLLETQEN
jgi:cysteinyl-tRNA synthetase